MRINLLKIIKRIISNLKVILWKILYGKNIKIGKSTYFYPYSRIHIGPKGKIKIGNNCFFNINCSINSAENVEIGNDCIFGENVCIYDHNHVYSSKSEPIRKQGYKSNKITIGNNCWIGTNSIILPGVKIGSNVIIGAGTVVYKNINDNSIVVNDSKYKYINKGD